MKKRKAGDLCASADASKEIRAAMRLTAADLAIALWRAGVVPVVTVPDPALAVPLAGALVDAGLPCIEVAFRAPGAAEAIAAIRRAYPDMLVGAGTVLTTEQADAALDAGASFIVAPGTNPRVVEYVLARDGVMLPGVATPSEIEANLARGLRVMKFFPAEALGGVGFLTSMYGPFPDVTFVPSGGVSASNLRAYLASPNVCAVGGTWIAPKAALQARDFTSVRRAASEALAVVTDLRSVQAVAP